MNSLELVLPVSYQFGMDGFLIWIAWLIYFIEISLCLICLISVLVKLLLHAKNISPNLIVVNLRKINFIVLLDRLWLFA